MQLNKAPAFQVVRGWSGLISVILEGTGVDLVIPPTIVQLTEVNFPRTMAFDPRGHEDTFAWYWTATTFLSTDRLSFAFYTLDGGASAPTSAWILVDTETSIAPQVIIESNAFRSNYVLPVLIGRPVIDAASGGLQMRATFL